MDKYVHFGDYYMLATGILLVLTVVTSPHGISGRLHRIRCPPGCRDGARHRSAALSGRRH